MRLRNALRLTRIEYPPFPATPCRASPVGGRQIMLIVAHLEREDTPLHDNTTIHVHRNPAQLPSRAFHDKGAIRPPPTRLFCATCGPRPKRDAPRSDARQLPRRGIGIPYADTNEADVASWMRSPQRMLDCCSDRQRIERSVMRRECVRNS